MPPGVETTLRVMRLNDLACVPQYQSEHAAGMDLHAALQEAVSLQPGEIRVIPCGIAIAVPHGYEAQVRPRSGLASRHGISMPNTPGTIDSDYRGEVRVPLINLGPETFSVEPSMRIAQMVIGPVTHCRVETVEALDETVRGAGGFGSTGVGC